jgi:tRNA nucleotidyltransferase/poly(A) polymerase
MYEVWVTRSYDSTAMTDEPLTPAGDLVSRLPDPWRDLAIGVCQALGEAGYQGWIVGGAVRDLCLGRDIKDVDLVSAALPDTVEGLFERTVAVGKSFGIIVVVVDGREVELATFRRERGYSDRRRPDEVEYASSPEEDARRRDFTCNAVYLDPLTGEVRDPAGGVADLRAGILRAVGDAAGRFREDGLRILRMARFVSTLDLTPAPGLLTAAEREGEALSGVSAERVRDELSKMMRGGRPSRALEILVEGGHAERSLPPLGSAREVGLRLDVIRRLEEIVGAANEGSEADGGALWELGLGALFGPVLTGECLQTREEAAEALGERLTQLRCSREERRGVAEMTAGSASLVDAAEAQAREGAPEGAEDRGRLVQLWRQPSRPAAVLLARAWTRVQGGAAAEQVLMEALTVPAELHAVAPEVPTMLTAGDLQDLGVPRGPELGRLLNRVQRASLGGAFEDRAGALEWARAQLR